MLKSMTGYGKAEAVTTTGRFTVEIKSVNHRYGEVSMKLPRQFLSAEVELRRMVSQRFTRGKIDVFVQYESAAGGAQLPRLNLPLAVAYFEAFNQLREHLNLEEPVSLASLIAQKDILVSVDVSADEENGAAQLSTVLTAALDSMESMRIKEGNSLFEEVSGRIAIVSGIVEAVTGRAPVAVAANIERLKERVARLLADIPLDEARLAQEAALLADRMDVTEEIVRLKSHFKQFDTLVESQEPVGRKLDFLLQEMNREVNTIGSKANDPQIAAMVVELKSEMEKIREQIQNVE